MDESNCNYSIAYRMTDHNEGKIFILHLQNANSLTSYKEIVSLD